MPRVTVRLGALTRSDGRWAQKGVDAAMHAELTELARNRACSDIVLVTGDGDLLPGLMSAKEHGVAVHLWAVQAADGDYNQSEDLVAEADERRVLDRTWITRAVRAKELGGPCAPPPVPRPEIAAILSAPLPESAVAARPPRPPPASGRKPPSTPMTTPAPTARPAARRHRGRTGRRRRARRAGSKVVPTPKDLAGLGRAHAAGQGPAVRAAPPRRRPRPVPPCAGRPTRAGSSAAARSANRSETAALPTLAQLTSAEQRWADREEDITAVSGDPFEVGQVFARRWTDRLSDTAHLQQLSTEYPRIPHRIDGELLRYAARFGLLAHKDDQIDEHDRYAIRAGFWREVDLRTAAEHAPAGD